MPAVGLVTVLQRCPRAACAAGGIDGRYVDGGRPEKDMRNYQWDEKECNVIFYQGPGFSP